MKIRVADISDVAPMHRIRLAVRENRLLDPTLVQPADYHRMIRELGRAWVAEIDGAIVGFAIADRSRANIWALFVDPQSEGRGIGRALHGPMIDWLFDSGVETIWLSTEPGTRAEQFYRAAGWRDCGAQRGETRFEMSRRDWLQRRSIETSDA